MTYQVAAIKDQYFTGENAEYSRGWMACYRKVGSPKWIICKDWHGDGHGAGINATVWASTPEAAKEAARSWLKKRLRK